MIYHLLPENVRFSMHFSSAISQVVANIMRFDESNVVVCSSADATWGYGADRTLIISELIAYSRIRGRRLLPPSVRGLLIRYVFRELLGRLNGGDIVWCHDQPYLSQALGRSIRLKGARLIYHSHDSLAPYAARSVYKAFSRPFAPDAFIFVSEAMRQEAQKLFSGIRKTYAVHNGADEASFFPRKAESMPENDVPIILYAGRLIPKKGIGILIDAMRILQKRHVEAVCKVFGWPDVHRGNVPAYLKWLVKNSPSNVSFEGFRSAKDIGDEYRRADIFCCPSVWQEPCCLVNIQAIACGIAVVATRVGGNPEIASGGGVLLVEPGSPVDLANALHRLVSDKALRSSLAEEGLSSYKRSFTWSLANTHFQQIVKGLEQGF